MKEMNVKYPAYNFIKYRADSRSDSEIVTRTNTKSNILALSQVGPLSTGKRFLIENEDSTKNLISGKSSILLSNKSRFLGESTERMTNTNSVLFTESPQQPRTPLGSPETLRPLNNIAPPKEVAAENTTPNKPSETILAAVSNPKRRFVGEC